VGSPCLDDATPCYTTDVCAAGGVCQHVPATDPACLQPTAPGKALLKIEQRADPSKSRVTFKWTKGPVVSKASFGTPSLGTTTYAVCLYDESAGVVQGILEAEPGPIGDCVDATCWKETATGWKLKSRYGFFEGVVSMKLREGLVPGRANVQAKLKGSYLSVPVLPLAQDPHVTAEVRSSDGQCFGARFSTAVRNEPARFIAKSD
jgi:hypothetical protein